MEVIFLGCFLLSLLMVMAHTKVIIDEIFYFSPIVLYRITNMNWFGCYFISILALIANPLYCCITTIGYILVKFYEFIYWILHVGRKK